MRKISRSRRLLHARLHVVLILVPIVPVLVGNVKVDLFIDAGKGQADLAHTGRLYLDEVKIKEGRIWDARTDELIGSTNFPNEPCDVLQNSIATHAF